MSIEGTCCRNSCVNCVTPKLSAIALLLFPLGLELTAQTTAYTGPMGGSIVTIAGNVSGGVFVSCPYIHENDFIGEVGSVTDGTGSSELFFSGAPFMSNAFDEVAPFPRYYLEITEPGHIHEGYAFDIVSNTANSVVLPAELATDFSLLAGDEVQIRKHMTLEDFFADAEGSLYAYYDAVKFFNFDGTSDLYSWEAGLWSGDFGVTDSGARPIYPGEAFLATFRNPITFIVSGKVKATKTILPIPASQSIPVFFGSTSPVEETLGSLGLANGGLNDYYGNVKFFASDGTLLSEEFYSDEGAYMSADFGVTDASNVIVAPSEGLFISNGGIATTVVLPAPYPLNP